jgi:hypothetical protein
VSAADGEYRTLRISALRQYRIASRQDFPVQEGCG